MKICGLTANEDALTAEGFGADLLGVVLTPGFRRSVAVEDGAAVVEGTSVGKVAVLVDASPDEGVRAAAAIGASVIQLHGHEGPELVKELRQRGEWEVWKAVRAESVDDVRRTVDSLGPLVDGVLVEGWKEGVVGGGGARLAVDAREVRDAIPGELHLILAGGLNPSNVATSVARFRPDVVDVSSGVEREVGRKDPELVKAFVQAARESPSS